MRSSFSLAILRLLLCTFLLCAVADSSYSEDKNSQSYYPARSEGLESDDDSDELEDDLLDLDIEQLGNVDVVVPSFDIEVSSVTKSKSTIGKSPAAIFVITQEMIRRNGARNIPEILRMAPGIQVAQVDSNKWTVSSRGFNGFISNRTLVLIDGRKVATPLFEGVVFGSVNWDAQDLVIEDIERIEVVRGPGGTLWGASAVNGVINIITKSAKDTQGTLYSGGVGDEDKSINSLRQGGSVGNNFHYRVYAKQSERGSGANNHEEWGRHGDDFKIDAHDDWRQQRFGFRSDWDVNGCGDDVVTFQGDYYQGNSGFAALYSETTPTHEETLIDSDTAINGGNFLARWTRTIDEETSYSIQAYYDNVGRRSPLLHSEMNIFDVEMTNRFSPWVDHQITWGGRFRSYNDELDFQNTAYLYGSEKQTRNMASVFVQDEIDVIEDVLKFWIGTKVEHNDFTGIEIQPNARFLWMLDERRAIWGAVSRAVRTPSRTEDDLRLNIGLHTHSGATQLAQYFGSRDLQSENVLAYELGYRAQPTDNFSWDVAGFYNEYSDLIAFTGQTLLTAPAIPAGHFYLRDVFDNNMRGAAYGAEVTTNLSLTDWWRIMASYSYTQISLKLDSVVDKTQVYEEGASPHSQVFCQSSWDLSKKLQLDLSGRYVERLPASDDLERAYIEMNARLGYRPDESWEFALIGTNLLNPSHREFDQLLVQSTRPQRGVFAQVIWRR